MIFSRSSSTSCGSASTANTLPFGHGRSHGDGVDAGAGAVVDDGLGAAQAQQIDDGRLRQRLEPRRILESLPVLRVERVGHQASVVVISNSGG